MNVTIGSAWLAHGQSCEESIDVAADREIRKLNPEEHAAFLGRLINLLCERGVITPQEAGELFFRDWK